MSYRSIKKKKKKNEKKTRFLGVLFLTGNKIANEKSVNKKKKKKKKKNLLKNVRESSLGRN